MDLDKELADLFDPNRPAGITLDYISTAQQCDAKCGCGLDCTCVLGDPHVHMCFDCDADYPVVTKPAYRL